jgi:D-beta-D-heptose 7-phosphate kinase/D-beta-D-heptose 1-phosphate adenosyltransferase
MKIKKLKLKNKKNADKKKEIIVAVSGGFDPVHKGHVRMFNEAKRLGDKLIVILNNDNWLRLKKGYVFMDQEERKEIIESFRAVDEVIMSFHEENTKDISICEELKKIRPNIFAKGGDRHSGNIPETPVCEEIGCLIVNEIGHGGKVQSSSWLVKQAKDNTEKLNTRKKTKK